jgi:RimJ/RimL family protein N-acetyltransferase
VAGFTYPGFETERLVMRPPADADIPSYQRNFADWEVVSQLARHVPWPYPADGAATFFRDILYPGLASGRKWFWVLALKTDPGTAVGAVDLWRDGRPENRGFWLAKAHWGRGLMSEAVTPVTEYAFTVLGFETLVFANAVGNARSRRIKEKQGARLVRVEPAAFVDPRYTEHEVWELRRDAWRSRRSSRVRQTG